MRMVDAEHALDAADHAANRGADHRADRARDAVALVKAVRGPTRNALRLRGQRRRDGCEKYARQYCHLITRPFLVQMSARTWPSMKAARWPAASVS